tara:strand:+ start:208 stop:429 length:222 start_codon:yes stop_codon:yes gene_type:complete
MSPETQALALEIEIKSLGFQVDRNMYRKIANLMIDKIITEYEDMSKYFEGKNMSINNAVLYWKQVKKHTNDEE